MRTSFHHQPEAQHPNFPLSTSRQADYPIFHDPVKREVAARAYQHGECGKWSTLPQQSKRKIKKGAVAAEPSERLRCWPSRNVRGALVSEHFWIWGERLRAARRRPGANGERWPSVARG